MQVKPLWFISAAYCGYELFKLTYHKFGTRHEEDTPIFSKSQIALALFLLLPVALTSTSHEVRSIHNKIFDLNPWKRSTSTSNLTKLSAWIEANKPSDANFYRFAFDDKNHALTDTVALSNIPFLKLTYTPATEFVYKTFGTDIPFLKAHNVKYVIFQKTQKPSHHLKLIERIGDISIYEFKDWNDQFISYQFGSAKTADLLVEDHEIKFKVSTEEEGRLVAHSSYFPHWRATINGEPVKIEPTAIEGVPEARFLGLPLKSGEYRITFTLSWVEYMGYFISLATLCALVFGRRRFANLLDRSKQNPN